METKYLSCAETAKLVRAALAKQFPGIKFSVRSDVYAGGASIDIRWTLGPTVKEVDRIGKQYASADFDGMIDMETNYAHWLLPDGTAVVQSGPGTEGSMGVIPAIKPQSRPEGAQLVSFGAHYVQSARSYAAHWEDEAKFDELVGRALCELQHVEYQGPNTQHLFGDNDQRFLNEHARELVGRTSFKAGEEYAGVRFSTEEERNSEGWDPWDVFVMLKKGPPAVLIEQGGKVTPLEVGKPVIIAQPAIIVRENPRRNGIELTFPAKPSAAIIETLKANGWRWSHSQGLWYNKMSPEAKAFAERILGADKVPAGVD